ncbi:YtpI family protein [Kurthia zopfii]|uniref:YtpI family protein n=1 Tax=Kurthia zopfii TaxID=1650 RepID=UPI000F6C065B|nr:YtpI family protein [Kurthia zopfii]VEI08382.1 Uncharacterised protein [Kurthia zopfii]
MLVLNIILAVFIIITTITFAYFKFKQTRTTLPIRKKWYRYRAGEMFSVFLTLFGINQIFLYPTLITYVIGAIFIIYGVTVFIGNFKRARHYGKFVVEEFSLNN